MKNRKILLISGLLTVSLAQVISHFFTLPDFASGLLMGIGLGLLLLSLLKPNAPRPDGI
jgi:hypothetical protein